MRIGFKVVLYILTLNLVTGLIYALNVPGVTYAPSDILGSQGNATRWEQEFNATTNILDRWTATPYSGVPIFGDIFSGIFLIWNVLQVVVMGFPMLVEQYIMYIPDAALRSNATLIMYVIRAIFSFIFFLWIFQLITGRRVSE